MLRRAQTRTIDDDSESQSFRGGEMSGRGDRRARDGGRTEADWAEAPIVDRRNLDAWRAEVLQTLVTDDEAPVQSGKGGGWRSLMQPSRILLLLVALIAGGVAAYLATRDSEPLTETIAQPASAPATAPVTQIVQAPTMQVLVASQKIAAGERITPASLQWTEWPETAMRPEYITITSTPGAIDEMSQSMARGEFFPGEPIRREKLAVAGEGFLSAILKDGTRGVSVAVAAESASGGFIVPDDHVDVVLTRPTGLGQMSETILTDVRILAINAWLGGTPKEEAPADETEKASTAGVFSNTAIATLELDPAQAEVIINSTTVGKLALVLRPKTETADAGDIEGRMLNKSIRLSSPFWTNSGPGGQ